MVDELHVSKRKDIGSGHESSSRHHDQHASKQLVQDGYDQIAPRYLEWITYRPSVRPLYLSKLLKLLPEKSKILELGCGAGVPTTQLLAQTHEVTANDISTAQIELAKKRVPEAKLVQGDMMSLIFAPATFNAAVAFYSIIHLPRDEQVVMLQRIEEWLCDGGYLLLNLGVKDDPGTVERDWLGGKMYWSSYDAEANEEMVKKAGFELVEREVIEEDEDGHLVSFLWILARKGNEVGAGREKAIAQ